MRKRTIWYDGDGLRVRQRTCLTDAASVVNDDYIWKAVAGLPVVLQDVRTPQDGGSTATTTYLYGLGLISSTDSGGVTSYALADGLGSTTQLTDSAGAVTDTYSYDVFGASRTTTGTTANDFRYAGEQRDGNANRGLYFLRARSYDPTLGRFLEKDPLPLGNRYSYAGNNAPNFTDPTGLCSVCDYVHDKGADVKDWGTDVSDHPGSLIQITAGTAVAVTSTGDRRREGGVTVYEKCGGACSWILGRVNQEAITLGHTILSRGPVRDLLLIHELTHVGQGDRYGLLWAPKYFLEAYRHGYNCNRFEKEARRAAGEQSLCGDAAGQPGKE